jgi:hypothetical protein
LCLAHSVRDSAAGAATVDQRRRVSRRYDDSLLFFQF